MPDTTLHAADQRTGTLVGATPMSQEQAFRHMGWVMPVDYVCVTLCIGCLLTVLAWKIFGEPNPWNILCCFAVLIIVLLLWVVALLFRCTRFVLLTQAYLNTLPEDAARIVMAAYGGQVPRPPQNTRR